MITKCPHCGKVFEVIPPVMIWMKIKGKVQSIEKTAFIGRPGTRWFEKNSGPRIIHVMEKRHEKTTKNR